MYDYKSSNAWKLDYTNDGYRNDLRKHSAKEENSPKSEAKNNKPKDKQASVTIKRLFMVTVCFFLAFFVVRGYVAINEADNHINELSHDLRMVQAENQAIKAKIDKSVDLKNLQSIANEKFGMVRPENYQVFYINLDNGDYLENVSEKAAGENQKKVPVEGVTGVLINSADIMFK